MKDFNYEKAYFTQALPAFRNFNAKQKDAHSKLLPIVKDLNQARDLNIPVSKEMKAILNDLTCQELAEMARASYFLGHWKPSGVAPLFDNKSGESWKIANVCDQILRSRIALPHNVLIHDGKFRVTFSNKDNWLWDEFGLATEKNLDIFKTCGLSFGLSSIKESAKKLAYLCADLWGDVDDMANNQEYLDYLVIKKGKALDDLKKRHADKLAGIEKDIENSKIELAAFKWLIENDIEAQFIENCIYYDHTGRFCFGWREKLTDNEKELLTKSLAGFPYTYDLE